MKRSSQAKITTTFRWKTSQGPQRQANRPQRRAEVAKAETVKASAARTQALGSVSVLQTTAATTKMNLRRISRKRSFCSVSSETVAPAK